jgi:nifR3 family TIM-barrel protein
MKFRMGIDDDHLTFRDSGRIAEGEGCAAVALHARTAAQLYDGEANWEAISELRAAVRAIPVFGNGDIFEARDAVRMMRATGCDGVVVGRGCLGRPRLFRDLAEVFEGGTAKPPPRFREVAEVMREHAELLALWVGERRGIRIFRRHATWYTKGYGGGARVRERLCSIETLDDLDRVLSEASPGETISPDAVRLPRGKSAGRQRVALPAGYLESLEDATPPCPEAEDAVSGG